ncbi:hypothetical protein FHR32_005006 [Streptosporangium album]|uniref:Uncharacterized protein n=1 Tax=Streptosporangium album TaxID=47479 RepID=A0A7W7RYJ9_9ACTN|nr:hypothetical protein [Streptosporangium album]MBB4940629.1 hypothetical protein [Streptosporangium album]
MRLLTCRTGHVLSLPCRLQILQDLIGRGALRQRRAAGDLADDPGRRAEVAEVMIWLRSNHGREVSYADIAAGVGIKVSHRLRQAVRVARVIATNRGDRLERFMPSTDPARRRVWVTRYMRCGLGDEFSARDAMSAARTAMTAMKDMHRATAFTAGSPGSIARQEFETMAKAAAECLTKISGIDTVGPQVVRRENTSLLTGMIADLEARLAEPAAG